MDSTGMAFDATPFDFVHRDRTYTCHVRPRLRGWEDAWWWFAVSGDKNRYAPFRAERGDTEESVRERVVTYYEEHRAPRVPRFGRRFGAPAKPQ